MMMMIPSQQIHSLFFLLTISAVFECLSAWLPTCFTVQCSNTQYKHWERERERPTHYGLHSLSHCKRKLHLFSFVDTKEEEEKERKRKTYFFSSKDCSTSVPLKVGPRLATTEWNLKLKAKRETKCKNENRWIDRETEKSWVWEFLWSTLLTRPYSCSCIHRETFHGQAWIRTVCKNSSKEKIKNKKERRLMKGFSERESIMATICNGVGDRQKSNLFNFSAEWAQNGKSARATKKMYW